LIQVPPAIVSVSAPSAAMISSLATKLGMTNTADRASTVPSANWTPVRRSLSITRHVTVPSMIRMSRAASRAVSSTLNSGSVWRNNTTSADKWRTSSA
jgi:hypothetical protein